LDLIAVAAEPFAVTRAVIGSDSSSNLSAVTIDVGGGTTDIAVVNDGGVEGTKMYGIGGRAFTKTIAADMNTDFEKAEELKLKLGTQELDEPAEAKVKNAVDKTLSVWLDGVKLALGEFDQVDHLPNQLLLCGGGASLSQLVQALETSEWYKEAAFTRRPSVKLIEPSQVVGVVDLSGKVSDHTFITAMGLLRVGLDTLNPDEDSGNIIDKLNKLLKV
jgi:cell division protein FtsA